MNLKALQGLDRDLQQSLLNQVRDLLRDRKQYIDILAQYELASGRLTAKTGVWPAAPQEVPFNGFCQRSDRATRHLVEQAADRQARRNRRRNGRDAE